MVGFPTCVKCDCNPDGSRFLPGLGNNVCYGSAKVNVLLVGNSNQLLKKLSAEVGNTEFNFVGKSAVNACDRL